MTEERFRQVLKERGAPAKTIDYLFESIPPDAPLETLTDEQVGLAFDLALVTTFAEFGRLPAEFYEQPTTI